MILKQCVLALCVNLAGLAVAVYSQHTDLEVVVAGGLAVEPRIAEGEFGEAPNPANVADEPGIEVDDGIFSSGETLGFDVSDVLGKNLWYWDGGDVSSVDFTDSPHDLTIEHPLTSATSVLTSDTGGGVSGFLIGVADPAGGIHQDLEFVLDSPTPSAGVYLFGIELNSDSYTSSDTVYFVLASGVDEAVHDAAVDWATTTFVIPEPSGLAFLWLLPLLWMSQRRFG